MNIKFYLVVAAFLLFSYLLGGIPFGFIIGKLKGFDIRKEGSCNVGATNVTRVVGPLYGKICFFCDLLKGFIPVFVASRYFKIENAEYIVILCGLFAVLGHMFTPYLKFRGGKGVATAGGVILALAWLPFVIAFAIWTAVFLSTRYVSLGSICASAALPIAAAVLKLLRLQPQISWAVVVFFAVIGIASIWKHKSNIIRLKNGTELKFERKGKA